MRDVSSQIFQNVEARIDYLHDGAVSDVCAFEVGERCEVRLRLSRSLAALGCEIVVLDEYYNEAGTKIVGEWVNIIAEFDEYRFDLASISNIPSLRFFYVKLDTSSAPLYIKCRGREYITEDSSICDVFQISFTKFEYSIPKKILGGVIYHVFVDRFRRGGEVSVSEGAVLIDGEWENIPEYPEYPGAPLKNNTFYGGTLYGIIEKLDYIKSLGTTVLYLSPIFSSVSNHKYDTADYMTVDEMFGGDEALSLLIKEADNRGISIILDGVFNHTGDDSIYFNKYSRFESLGAYNSPDSKYYNWYDFKEYPDKYTCWWDIPILPRINPDITECGEYIAGDSGVVDKYRKMGVFGFRLDVADELSDAFISKIKARLSNRGESLLIGEVWEDASNKVAYGVRKSYYLGRELDGVMNYPVRVGLIDYILNGDAEKLRYALSEVICNMPRRIRDQQMNLLGSHDTVRILTALSGIGSDQMNNTQKRSFRLSENARELAVKRLESAYTVLATLPGLPSVFYGDEAGLEGFEDPFCRMPYPWGREDNRLLSRYKRIGEIRSSEKVYRDGKFEILELTDDRLVFVRRDERYSYITVFNNSTKFIKFRSDVSVKELISGKRLRSIELHGYESVIFKVKGEVVFEIISEEEK